MPLAVKSDSLSSPLFYRVSNFPTSAPPSMPLPPTLQVYLVWSNYRPNQSVAKKALQTGITPWPAALN